MRFLAILVFAMFQGAVFAENQASNISSIVNAIVSNNPAFQTATSRVDETRIPDKDLSTSWRADPVRDAMRNTGLEVNVPSEFYVLTIPPTDMVYVPGGRSIMGLAFGGMPISTTEVSSFYMDIHECTADAWRYTLAWATNNGYSDLPQGSCGWTKDARESTDTSHPVVSVSWFDAVKWCNAKSEQEGLMPVYYLNEVQTVPYRSGITTNRIHIDLTANGYRLPTEAEWERAAKGGNDRALYSCGTKLDKMAMNFWDSGDIYDNGTTPACFFSMPSVTSGRQAFGKGENSFGLFDLSGNVYEWCWDWYERPESRGMMRNPTGPETGEYKVIKGGSWKSKNPSLLHCSYRQKFNPRHRDTAIGFRCVRRP